jgi:hypothetical protein
VAWDSSRPVPWQRLIREWLLYVGIMGILFVLFFRETGLIGIIAGLFVSGPLYLAFGYVLAKFGYQRKTYRELREDAPTRGSKRGSDSKRENDVDKPRPKPAPTSRTGGGSTRPNPKRRR